MAEKNEFYNDFSNRRPFNNIPCRKDEILAPVVVDDDFKDYLKTLGLDWNNVETWHYMYGRTVPVAFIQVKTDEEESAMSYFRAQTTRYLKRYQKTEWDEFSSIEDMIEAANDDDRKGCDPTGTTENEDNAFLELVFDMLVEELNAQNPIYGRIIELLSKGYNKGEILDIINLGVEKTQGYNYIKSVQKIAKEIWYRDR